MVKESVKGEVDDSSVLPTKRICGTMPVHHRLLREVESYAKNRALIENHARMFARRLHGFAREEVATIQTVVHVVYNTEKQNISDEQIKSQIDVLNRDFRKLNDDVSKVPSIWQDLVADTRIEFVLATKDPDGKPTTGIIRTKTLVTSFSHDDRVKSKANGGENAWDAKCYLNIWVCLLGGGLLGYAQFPGGPLETDGVVITHTAFGTTGTAAPPFNKGRTATHEVGHWLDLRHIWGDDGEGCTGSDSVDDTPNQGGYNTGCPDFPHVSCNNRPNGDMFMNYMDYTDDRCMFMFTTGQVSRIDACLEGPRSSLLTCIVGKTGKIKGTVLDKSNQTPIHAALVAADTPQSASTDENGFYTLDNVPIGDRTIKVHKDGYRDESQTVTVEIDKEINANFELRLGVNKITGKVVYKTTNEPVESARISTDTGQNVMTGSDGTYELIDVPTGDLGITAVKTGCKCACALVTVKEGEAAIGNFKLCDSPVSRVITYYAEGIGKSDQEPPAEELTDKPIPLEVAKAKAAKVSAKVSAKAAVLRKGKTVLIINGDNNIHYEDDQSVLTFMSAFQNMGDEVRVEQAKDTSYSTWSSYDIIVWSCGDDYSAIDDINSKQMLVDYVAQGGCLILEGGNIAAWIRETGTTTLDRKFREKVLHATTDWVYHDVGDLVLKTEHPIATTPNKLQKTICFTPTEAGDYSGDANAVRILPDATCTYGWSYVAYRGNLVNDSVISKSCGVIAYESENGGRIVYYAFDIDDIDSSDIQEKLIQNSANWLKPETKVNIVRGNVVNSKTKEPIESATIYTDAGQSTKTGSDGTYELIDVPTGDRAVTAIKTGCKCACTIVTVEECKVATANFELCNGSDNGNCIIADCAEGLGKFDQESSGYPEIDNEELYNGKPTCKALDVCGIQAHAGYYLVGSGGNEFEFNIDKCPTLNLTMKAEKDTDTCLLLMVHDKKPSDHISRFIVVGKTPKGNRGFYDLAKDCFTIKDDGQWHDYTYDLRKLKEDYHNAETIRIVQFNSYRDCDGTSRQFNFSRLTV